MTQKPDPEQKPEPGADSKDWRGKDGRRRYDVEPEQFIEAWESSDSAEEVAEKLKMPRAIVHARATKYRDIGIKLKNMPRRGRAKPLAVDQINARIDELRKGKGRSDDLSTIDLSNSAVVDKVVELVIARLLALGIVRLGGQTSPPTTSPLS